MAATEDNHWRAISIWQHGLLDRLPEEIDHGIIACTVDEEGYAMLMHNVSHALMQWDNLQSEADNIFILETMAALHAAFWNDSDLSNPVLNLARPRDFFTHTAPDKIRLIAETNSSGILEIILDGWRLVPEHIDADVADLLQSLAHDPSPLCNALASYPQTLVHGDWHLPNFGITQGEHRQLILFDWARPMPTVPAVDLAYYMVTSSHAIPTSKEQTIEVYKQRLASRLGGGFDESWWRPQLEISLLGAFLPMVCFKVWFLVHEEWEDVESRMRIQAELRWWTEQARVGARWLAS